MKIDFNGDGLGDDFINYPECITSVAAYGIDYNLCGTGDLVSTSQGIPLTNVTHAEAVSLCEGIGGQLISNAQWMTIARNIEQVGENWSGGEVGSGSLYKGIYTLDDYQAGLYDASYDYSDQGLSKRTFTLTNGEIIWDLSGNAREILLDTIMKKDMPEGYHPSGYIFNNTSFWQFEYSKAGTLGIFYLNPEDLGNTTFEAKDLFLSNLDYNSESHGLGKINTYSHSTQTNEDVYAIHRSYGPSSGTGILGVTFNIPIEFRTSVSGLRCVFYP